MKYSVRHQTDYRYHEPVVRCYNIAHMVPRNTPRQTLGERVVTVIPTPAQCVERRDYFGNSQLYFSLHQPHEQLTIDITSAIDLMPPAAWSGAAHAVTCQQVRAALHDSDEHDTLLAREFVLKSPQVTPGDALREYAAPSFAAARPMLPAVLELTQRIFADFTFDPASTTVSTPLREVLQQRRGVCQDFAHLAIGCLRSLGYAARYVSGYIETVPPPGQQKLAGADASHAWFAVYVPGQGWVEFDPTNNQVVAEQHIVAAWGRDYGDVPPLAGVIFGGGSEQDLTVAVDVCRH